MVELVAADILTREVLDWRGLHLLHWHTSSCSQKTRIVLAVKGAEWTGHLVSLPAAENATPRFQGINPRGLVPVLVWDGRVHIESNDIVTLLDARLAGPRLIPAARAAEVAARLAEEDALHLALRTLSFRFVFGRNAPTKSPAQLAAYREGGSGTVAGRPDENKAREVAYWEEMARDGITDGAARAAAATFRSQFERLDATLAAAPYILGEELSLLDVAWYVYAHRLLLGGYPLARLHPHLARWHARLDARPAFAREVALPQGLAQVHAAALAKQRATGTTMAEVVGF